MSEAALLVSAVSALYGCDVEQTKRANEFLLSFTDQQAAWGASLEVLASECTDVNTQYFAANILYTKARRHWNQLDEEHKSKLSAALLQLLRREKSSPKVVRSRICLALAAAAIRAPNGVRLYVHEAFELCRASSGAESAGTSSSYSADPLKLVMMMDMLLKLREEVVSADCSRARNLELQDELRAVEPDVLQAVEFVIAEGMSGRAGSASLELLTSSLECCAEWFKLGTGLSEMVSKHASLFTALLQALRGGGLNSAESVLAVSSAACKVLEEVMAIQEFPRPSTRGAAADALLDALLETQQIFKLAADMGQEDACCIVAQLAVDFAGKEMERMVSGFEKGLAMVEYMLAMTGCPSRKVAIITMDFWLELQDIPVSERHPSLAVPVYERLLGVLLQQCTYPATFTTWEEYDGTQLDEDMFAEFRTGAQGAKDGLIVTYYMLRSRYLELAMSYVNQHATSWQALEAALLAVTHVSKEVKSRLQSYSASDIDAIRSEQVVRGLLREVSTNASLSSHPLVLSAGCAFVGSFASALVSPPTGGLPEDHSLLLSGIRYLSAGLGLEASRQNAAMSLRSLCVSCENSILSDSAAVEALMQTVESARSLDLTVDQWLILTEAITRIVAQLDCGQASVLLMRFASPLLHTLRGQLESQVPHNMQSIREALQQLAQAIRFLDQDDIAEDGGRMSVELLRALWPTLEAISVKERADETVMVELFGLISKMLRSLQGVIAQHVHISLLIKMILHCYDDKHYSCCLDCMSSAVEVYGSTSAEVALHFQQLLGHVASQTFAHIQTLKLVDAQFLARSYSELCHRYLLFCPEGLMQPTVLEGSLQLAFYCLEETLERDCARSILVFLTQTISLSGGKLVRFQRDVEAPLALHGANICRIIIKALAGHSPSLLWPNFIECLYALLRQVPQNAAKEWLGNALESDTTLSGEDKTRVMEVAYRLALENKQLFKSMMLDLAKISNNELTPDTLLAYTLG